MKIGVVGIGEMGGTLAARWSKNGHNVRVANSRGPEAVKTFAQTIGAVATDVYGAVEGADVVLFSMPFPAVAKLPKDLFRRTAEDAVIIDTANYYPDVRDAIPALPISMLACRKASGFRSNLAAPSSRRSTASCSTPCLNWEDPEGRQIGWPSLSRVTMRGPKIVMGLVNEMEFDPVDAGSLEESWRQQPSTPAYCCDYGVAKTLEGIRAAVKGKAEKIRDTTWRERYGQLFANRPAYADVHADVIALNRSLNPL